MKIYPKTDNLIDRGFTEQDIKNGTIYLYIDVQCVDCNKIQSYAQSQGKCIKCGDLHDNEI